MNPLTVSHERFDCRRVYFQYTWVYATCTGVCFLRTQVYCCFYRRVFRLHRSEFSLRREYVIFLAQGCFFFTQDYMFCLTEFDFVYTGVFSWHRGIFSLHMGELSLHRGVFPCIRVDDSFHKGHVFFARERIDFAQGPFSLHRGVFFLSPPTLTLTSTHIYLDIQPHLP